jgi:hypothetical protein
MTKADESIRRGSEEAIAHQSGKCKAVLKALAA